MQIKINDFFDNDVEVNLINGEDVPGKEEKKGVNKTHYLNKYSQKFVNLETKQNGIITSSTLVLLSDLDAIVKAFKAKLEK